MISSATGERVRPELKLFTGHIFAPWKFAVTSGVANHNLVGVMLLFPLVMTNDELGAIDLQPTHLELAKCIPVCRLDDDFMNDGHEGRFEGFLLFSVCTRIQTDRPIDGRPRP
jgi:hypothetical protein